MSILINLLLAFNVVVSILIVLLVLMQRPKSEGLGAAFGGGMTENLFGAQTTNVLANATRWLGGIFFLLTLVLSILTSHQSANKSSISKQLANAPKPTLTTPATPAVSGTGTASVPEAAKKAAPAVTTEKSAATPTPAAPAAATPAPAAAVKSATPAASAPEAATPEATATPK